MAIDDLSRIRIPRYLKKISHQSLNCIKNLEK